MSNVLVNPTPGMLAAWSNEDIMHNIFIYHEKLMGRRSNLKHAMFENLHVKERNPTVQMFRFLLIKFIDFY